MKSASVTTYIGIGSNIPPREEHIQAAVDRLRAVEGIELLRASSVYETEPWGMKEQGPFLNAVLECATTLEPAALHTAIKGIEEAQGREQTERYGPRKIDLDILLYGMEVVDEAGLQIPHPRMRQRRFVLVPLAEVAPSVRHPLEGSAVADLLATCPDMGRVWKHAWSIGGAPGIAERTAR